MTTEPFTLRIQHTTTYRYKEPVHLGPHRLMIRPRESVDLRLLSHVVTFSPDATVVWAHDVFDNAVATATFAAKTDALVIESAAELQLSGITRPSFDIAVTATSYPFKYDDDEWKDLGTLTTQQYPDPDGNLKRWALGFVLSNPTDTLALLKDVADGVTTQITYQARDAEGTQPPLETLNLRTGSCRDYAVLFMETVRSLGFGARLVSGYLYSPELEAVAANMSTHAWAEVFVPGAGWITFDPTNQSVGGGNLIPVGVGRDIRQVMPVVGNFLGMPDAFISMTVEVSVSRSTPGLAPSATSAAA